MGQGGLGWTGWIGECCQVEHFVGFVGLGSVGWGRLVGVQIGVSHTRL